MGSRWTVLMIIITMLTVPLTALCQQRAPVWAYQIEAVNRDVREVLDDLFSKAGKQYVIEPGVGGTVSLRISTNSFEEALNRVLQSAGLACHVDRAQAPGGRLMETYVVRARPTMPLLAMQTPMDILSRPVNLVASTSLRNVLTMLSRQTGVSINASREVPDLQVTRLVLSNVTLGYALNIIAQATQTQYQFQPDGSILLVPAPQIAVKGTPSAAAPRQVVDPITARVADSANAPMLAQARSLVPVLKCSCGTELQSQWNYCPMCGKKVAKPVPQSPRK